LLETKREQQQNCVPAKLIEPFGVEEYHLGQFQTFAGPLDINTGAG
jgi:hypothetical protein